MTDLWYAAYGSNLDPDRFACYIHGGQPAGATRTYPGVRDQTEPESRPLTLPGRVSFRWESSTWGGGVAFYSPAPERVLACGYLLTYRQFSDVLEQEMWREPGTDYNLTELLTTGLQTIGGGRYETLRLAGEVDGRPVVTMSAANVAAYGLNPPAAAYVATMGAGLRRTHSLTDSAVADYLLRCPGVQAGWTAGELRDVLALELLARS